MIMKRNLKLNEVGEAGTALKNIQVAEIYSRSSQGGQAGSEPARRILVVAFVVTECLSTLPCVDEQQMKSWG